MKLPFEGKTPFSEKTVIGKVVYVAGVISAVLGAVLVTWETSAFASDRFQAAVTDIVHDHAITSQELMPMFQQMQTVQNMHFVQNQIGIKSLELRSIENELSRAVQDQTSLTPQQTIYIDGLKEDRTRVKDQLSALEQQLRNFSAQQQQLQQQLQQQ